MNDEINYKNNPLHGVGLKTLLNEMVEQYGFDILFAYLNINCFKTNASIDSSVKFLKKTEWAREKVESFYLYEFKSLPRASDEQFELPPRDRIVPENQTPGEPAKLSMEDADRLREKRAKRQADRHSGPGRNSGQGKKFGHQRSNRQPNRKENKEAPKSESPKGSTDPWAYLKK